MSSSTWPPAQGPNLTLQTAQTMQDVRDIAALYGLVFGPSAEASTCALATRYPGVAPSDFSLVRDAGTGEIASSISLLPTTWLYEGVPLRVAELAIVATHPDYRHRGLVRRQMRWFEDRLQQEGFDLSSIQGIPYFYRQFGYEYIIPMEGGYELRPEQIPDPLETEDVEPIRRARAEDLPCLLGLLSVANVELEVSLQRRVDVWRYQDDPERTDVEALDTYVVLDGGKIAGYFRLYRRESQDRPGVTIVEASPLPHRACLAALRLAKGLAAQRRSPQTIRLHLPPSTPLARMAAYLGGRARPAYAWQVRIPDAVRFLKRIAPALERRLAHSFLAGYSSFLRIDLYTDTLELDFSHGRLTAVSSLGPLESQAVRLPWWAAWQLWLGHRSREELCAWYPDARVDPALQPLVDVLFPKRDSWVFPTM